jgi:hypothetical protein
MPWKESTQVQARVRFIEDWLAKEHESLAVLCRVHGVSRKTGYKWVGRFKQGVRRAKEEHLQAGDVWVLDHRAHKGLPDALPTTPWDHEHVSDVSYDCVVGQHSAKAICWPLR